MASTIGHTAKVLRTSYQKSVAAYWDSEQAPVNLRLCEVDGLYHHHYGGPESTRDRRVIEELHRLETAQAEVLLDHLGSITAQDQLLDAGSGRGGTSFMAHQRFGCAVDGVTISEHQVGFANSQAGERGVAGQVPVHVVDLTAQTIPYWELRAQSSVATGIEDPFLTAYKEGSFHYLLIAADRT
ncbi:SAM-dependent methyltransferase [Streptoverticillium reticulum]|uniref:SAM-dependent methyltransferase n=1 Tax=Streptoverticillium reticulum TaxID=1433415 RepID=UPI0039BFEE7F